MQLHGDEDVDFGKKLIEKGIQLIKVFRVQDQLPIMEMENWEELADLFLFDKDTEGFGGSGERFDWSILKSYSSSKPYLLSGGIDLEDVDEIMESNLSGLVGLDVNSKFEIGPANKDFEKVELLKELIDAV